MKQVTVAWFEIPVHNMERAMAFYEAIFECKLDRHQMGPFDMAWFPWDENGGGAGGSLVAFERAYTPSHEGTLVYFSSEDVSFELGRVEKNGGKVIQGKTEISPEFGYMALFEDTEGNRMALHSNV
jgi:predicted enzyme related to lactoylglutathione lyase